LSARNGNQTASVPDAYTRYLANVFRKTYDLFATPVVIEYRTDANPYDRERRECQSGESARSPESAVAIAGADSRLLIGRRSRVKISVRTGAWGYRVCRRQRLNSTGNSWRRAPARCWCSSASRHPLRRPSSATALPTSRFTRPPWHCGTSRSSTARAPRRAPIRPWLSSMAESPPSGRPRPRRSRAAPWCGTAPYLEGPGTPFAQMHELASPEDAGKFVDYWAGAGMSSFKAYMNITRAELAAAADAAHRRGLRITGHLCSVSWPEAIAAGIDD